MQNFSENHRHRDEPSVSDHHAALTGSKLQQTQIIGCIKQISTECPASSQLTLPLPLALSTLWRSAAQMPASKQTHLLNPVSLNHFLQHQHHLPISAAAAVTLLELTPAPMAFNLQRCLKPVAASGRAPALQHSWFASPLSFATPSFTSSLYTDGHAECNQRDPETLPACLCPLLSSFCQK